MNSAEPQPADKVSLKAVASAPAASEGKHVASPNIASPGNGVPKRFSWRLTIILAAVVLGLGFIGFALTNYAPKRASWYWVVVLPAFAVLGVWQTWSSVRTDGKTNWPLIRKQIYHWLALFVALKVLFVLIYAGNVGGDAGGLVALLLVALTCTLVGVTFDWVFIPIGVLLGVSVLVAGLFQEYVWLGLVGLGLAFVLLLLLQRFGRPKEKETD
jgi:hypothetical protein